MIAARSPKWPPDDDTSGEAETGALEVLARRAPGNSEGGAAASCRHQRRARLLAERVRRLRQSERRKDDFIAVLGHELRNPLAALSNALELLGRDDLPQGAADQARSIMLRQLGHATRLVDDLLDLSRIARGKMRIERRPVDLAVVLAEVARGMEPVFTARALGFEVAALDEPVWIHGDEVRLGQIFTNLLQNAAKYTDPGGKITLTVARSTAQPQARGERHERSAVGSEELITVEVNDTGMGMTPSVLARVFEPFAQSSLARNKAPNGLGIGLALVQNLVELHGGEVSAHSAGPGRGSTFTVRLPCLPAPGARARGRASDGRKLSVLVVDDDADRAATLALLLEDGGHSPSIAQSGREALERLEVERFDAVLLDLELPGIAGTEAARRLRDGEGQRRTLLVAPSDEGEAEEQAASLQAGFDHHLLEPVGLEAVRALLGGARSGNSGRRH